MRNALYIAAAFLFLTAEMAAGQDNSVNEANQSNESMDLDSDAGLQGATPTDNINELNTGINNFGPESDLPETGNNLNLGAPASGGDNIFANPVSNLGNAGGPLGQGASSGTNVDPNAQILMNQIQAESAAPVSETSEDPAAKPAAPDVGPAAPALPPPNEFAGAPAVPGGLRVMADGEAPEEYKVERGDTLYDICDQLLDEPAYWPKLWSLNPEIKNPHFIFPNMRLRFYPGDDETPPYLQVITEDDVIPIDKGDLNENQLIAESVNFAKDEPQENAVEVVGLDQVEMAEELFDAFLTGGRVYESKDIPIKVPGFIYKEERVPLAYVIGGSHGEASLAPEQIAIMERTGGISSGTTYTVLRPAGKVAIDEREGHLYYFIANVRVNKAVDGDIYLGSIFDNRLAVFPDDIIVNYISTTRSLPVSHSVGALSSIAAEVVAFDFPGQEIAGMGHYAFINAGNGDGVSPGMYLSIVSTPGNLTSDLGNSGLPLNYEAIGVMRIIDTTDGGAVGYIVKNSREVRVGDRTKG